MKKIKISILLIFILLSQNIYSCGFDMWEGMSFFNLLRQTNISSEEYYPFLRDDLAPFYGHSYYGEEKKESPKGNIELWQKILSAWSYKDIENAVYEPKKFSWKGRNSKIEKRAKLYINFAQECSNLVSYRNRSESWDYAEIVKEVDIESQAEELLTKANILLKSEKNKQLKARYNYQIIKLMHYSGNWNDAVIFYENKVENKFPKNEIYYYITDQVAGCYYSTGNYEKAAYLFTKVVNNSIDRKMSAYISYSFCTNENAEGKSYFKGLEDQKDLLLITSLRNFTDEIRNIRKFINLDASDPRVELLFMRAINNVERDVLEKNIGTANKKLPYLKKNTNYKSLLLIAEQQVANSNVKNKDFWKLSSSYLSFINEDITSAKSKLNAVQTFTDQKKILSAIYEVFSWDNISRENENYLFKIFEGKIEKPNDYYEGNGDEDWKNIILDKVANTYYKNGEIAKAFLIHNRIDALVEVKSMDLLNDLSLFSEKQNKTDFEKKLMGEYDLKSFADYVNFEKGVYYLYYQNPRMALNFFNKNKSYIAEKPIPNTIFSNNTKECFDCDIEKIMTDKVYAADVFSFIKKEFTQKELAEYLLKLEELQTNEKKWKQKLANYLLGNYYFNISNTGRYRGLLSDKGNCCNYSYIYYADGYRVSSQSKDAETIIAKKSGYNLQDIETRSKKYFALSKKSMEYYQKTIDLSSDRELNARCLYMMAKCELNNFYNNGSKEKFTVSSEYGTWSLPKYKSLKILKEKYSDTEFQKMIIKECSYYRFYAAEL